MSASGAAPASLHPLVVEVADRQFSALKGIYLVLAGLLLAILVTTIILGAPFDSGGSAGLWWIEALLAGLSVLLLGLVMPLARRRFMGTDRLQKASAEDLQAAGLPAGIDLRICRQALYLTRYTAGCVITWGLCSAVGLYGLVARMMGAGALETGLFFALAAFAMALLPPDRARLTAALEGFY